MNPLVNIVSAKKAPIMMTTALLAGLFLCIPAGGAKAEAIAFSNVEARSVRDTSAVIQWDTDVAATGQVEYGPDKDYGKSTTIESISFWHSVEITGLSEGATCHYRIRARDYNGNETLSGNHTFATLSPAALDAKIRAARANGDLPKTYYVKTDGDDAKDGLSVGNAWQHPSHAARMAEAGDTLYLMDGTWHDEEIMFSNSGIDTHPISMAAYSGSPTLVNTGAPIKSGTSFKACIFGVYYSGYYQHREYLTISGLTIRDYEAGIYVRESSCIHISDCVISLAPDTSDTAIYFIDDTHFSSASNCTISGGAWNSVNIAGRSLSGETWSNQPSTHISIRDCDIYDNTIHNLVDLCGNVNDIDIVGNRLHNGSQSGLFTHQGFPVRIVFSNNVVYDTHFGIHLGNGGPVSDSVFMNNTMFNTGSYTVRGYTSSSNSFINNEIYNTANRGFYYGSTGTFIGNYVHDVGMVNYRLRDGMNTVRDPIENTIQFMASDGGDVYLEYSNNDVFTVSSLSGGTYSHTPPAWFTTKSSCSITNTADDTTFTVARYPITLRPTAEGEHLTVTSVSDLPDTVTVESTISTNSTVIGYTNSSYASSYVTLLVDGAGYGSEPADATGKVSHVYSGSWDSAHTFTWEKGEAVTGTLTGTVTDKDTGCPIENATLTIEALGLSCTTAADGTYLLSDVPIGPRTVTCTKTGYDNGAPSDVMVSEGANKNLCFALTPEANPDGNGGTSPKSSGGCRACQGAGRSPVGWALPVLMLVAALGLARRRLEFNMHNQWRRK
jgi:hypothetical protein